MANLQNGTLIVEAVTTSGRAAAVHFRPTSRTVEIWYAGRCAGTLEKADLARLLNAPGQRLLVSRVELRSESPAFVTITLDDVQDWLLSPADAAALSAFAGHLVLA